jgi:hypothetical protein
VACVGNFETASRKVPELDGSIWWASDKELVGRIDGETTHPAVVAADDSHQLPRTMPLRFDDLLDLGEHDCA